MLGIEELDLEGPYGKGKGPFGITIEQISASERYRQIAVKILNVFLPSCKISFLFNCMN